MTQNVKRNLLVCCSPLASSLMHLSKSGNREGRCLFPILRVKEHVAHQHNIEVLPDFPRQILQFPRQLPTSLASMLLLSPRRIGAMSVRTTRAGPEPSHREPREAGGSTAELDHVLASERERVEVMESLSERTRKESQSQDPVRGRPVTESWTLPCSRTTYQCPTISISPHVH